MDLHWRKLLVESKCLLAAPKWNQVLLLMFGSSLFQLPFQTLRTSGNDLWFQLRNFKGYAPAKNDFLFERKRSTRSSAMPLSNCNNIWPLETTHKVEGATEWLKEASLSFSDKQMQSYTLFGVGYHNGGLCLVVTSTQH
ncbi:hypothetical protein MKW98_009216, partial [Papaver atlanticum]